MTTTVLLADGQPLVRRGLRAVLESDPEFKVVGEAGDGAVVPDLVAKLHPDVVLMDVRMPRIDGIEATRRLVDLPHPPKVLVVTMFENDSYVLDALLAGASGFLLKRARPEEIVYATRTVVSDEALLFPEAMRDLVRSYDAGRTPLVDPDFVNAALSDREQAVLRLMSAGLSNSEIAAELSVGSETVKTHVGRVLAKLGARDRTQAVIVAYRSGFVS
ncbi:MAG: response regulator transcription factor [Nocardioidaceae bacterium]